MSQSDVGENSNSLKNTIPLENVHNVDSLGTSDESAKILAWLSPLEPWTRHRDITAHRVGGVGGWLLRTEEYRNWFNGIRHGEPDNSALFCYGDPGVGKTYIRLEIPYEAKVLLTSYDASSLVIDRLCDWATGRNAIVACLYFDFAARKEQSLTNILGSLLKQAVGGLEKIPAKIVQAFRDQGKAIGGRRLGAGRNYRDVTGYLVLAAHLHMH